MIGYHEGITWIEGCVLIHALEYLRLFIVMNGDVKKKK